MTGTCELPDRLVELRKSIDNIDAALIVMLAERFKCTRLIGDLKATSGLPGGDPDREAAQIARLRQLADAAGLDAAFAEKLLKFIIAEVMRHHDDARQGAQGTGRRRQRPWVPRDPL